MARFNPLPAFGPGDTVMSVPRRSRDPGFNPLPAFGPGDTDQVASVNSGQFVSIRSRLLGREILFNIAACCCLLGVSIRSRLLGREIPRTSRRTTNNNVFQSAPGFWAGRYDGYFGFDWHEICFNPLPAFGPGDTSMTS